MTTISFLSKVAVEEINPLAVRCTVNYTDHTDFYVESIDEVLLQISDGKYEIDITDKMTEKIKEELVKQIEYYDQDKIIETVREMVMESKEPVRKVAPVKNINAHDSLMQYVNTFFKY